MPKSIAADIHVGAVFQTTNGPVVITKIESSRHVKICFLEYPCEVVVRVVQIRNRMIKNPMRPSMCGIGYMGVGPYVGKKNGIPNPVYAVWSNMFCRVYSPATDAIARVYAETSIHPDWNNFQNFSHWYHCQIANFGPVDFKWHLDKDLLVPGNRMYGPDMCCVIPQPINEIFTDSAYARGEYPIGVNCRRTKNGKFEAQCKTPGSIKRYISTHDTIEGAQKAYWNYKFKMVHRVALQYWNYLPEPLAMRLVQFGWNDALAYYGDDAVIWHGR